MREQLLDPFDVTYAVLTHDDATFGLSGVRDPYFAAELMRAAANDYTIEQWLSKDPRLLGSLILNSQVPEWAADEIRRLGTHAQICQVLLGGASLDKPFGHPIFHPIYRAAEEKGLPVSLHVGAWAGSESRDGSRRKAQLLCGGPHPVAAILLNEPRQLHLAWRVRGVRRPEASTSRRWRGVVASVSMEARRRLSLVA